MAEMMKKKKKSIRSQSELKKEFEIPKTFTKPASLHANLSGDPK
jgi:hypothetical protein